MEMNMIAKSSGRDAMMPHHAVHAAFLLLLAY